MERLRRPSLRDVAERAGASVQTVSRVANGEPNVTDGLRHRVLTAMNELGYRPNAAARAIRRGAFNTIGVVYHDLVSVGVHRSVAAISKSAADHGFATTLMPIAVTSSQAADGAFMRLGEMAVDAIVVVLPERFKAIESLHIPPGVPTVVIGPPVLAGAAAVDFDQQLGARLAVEHLLSLGHDTVHHIGGPASSYAAESRLSVWATTLRGRDRPLPEAPRGDWTPASGYRAMQTLLERDRPSAIFAASDQMALGVYRAVQEAGLRIPHDISVVGFDDVAEAAMYAPPLTTIAEDWAELGRQAVQAVLEFQAGATPPSVTLPTRLVARDSTAPPTGHRS
ncbi:LacI family DNA-binding transcriptional regulator [Microbacterium sp.]|uniref:LacI family DNA-binding transcriptional regulator n=1 Tax=Microbacterium sp. TaxID=51671 RepID=UPI002734B293|nr:substrate-binding domain-containing protein [Microbacterium sp.]MDP3949503.1 substrate-binding domain-containing protein [Microbacterium sp.]